MNDKHKTKAQLIAELQELRGRVAQMEEAEKARHNRVPFRALAETAASAIFIFQDSVFRYANPATSRLSGYTSEELLGANIWDFVHPECREVLRERVSAWQRGEPVASRAEFKILTKSGETRWIDADSTFIEFDGNPAALTIAYDSTDHKRAEDDLRKQKETLQKIFDHIPVMIGFVGEDGRIKLVNPEWERTLGWSLAEMQNPDLDVFADFYPDPQYRRDVLSFIAASTGEWADFKTKVRDGRVIDTTFANVRLEDGTSIGIGQDITERKRSEEALRDSQERFRRNFDLGLIGMAITSPTGKYIEVNDQMCTILGYERSELLQMSWAELTHPGDLAANVANFNRVQAGESDGYSMDKRFIRKDGKVIHATISVKCLRRADGSVDYFVGMLQDITERKRADQLLRLQTARLGVLHEIELEISAESELSRVFDVVTRRAGESLNAAHCVVYTRDPERAELSIAASIETELIGKRLREGEGLAGRVVETGEALAVADYSSWEGRALTLDDTMFGPSLAAPLKWQHMVIGAISLGRQRGEEPFTDDDSQFLEQIAAEAAIAIHQATLFEDVQESRKRLQVLSHRLIDTQEAERKRLARELHDQIGQALTAVQISLHAMQSSQHGRSAGLLEDSLAIIDEAIQQVHDLSLDLRPSLLDDLGLAAALRWYVDRVASRAGLVRCFNADSLGARLAPEVETACFRIAQEALTNVQRHAQAATVWVTLSHRESRLQLLVEDDGVGFDARAGMSRTGPSASLGLQGMRERAAAIGGLVEIKSNKGSGTEVRASFPLKPTPSS